MRHLLILAALFLPTPALAVTLTSDVTYNYLEVQTGSTLDTDGWNVTVGGGSGSTMIYGTLDATHLNGDSTLFTQKSGGFRTKNAGTVIFTGTGTIKLTGSGSRYPLDIAGSPKNLTLNNGLVAYYKLDDGPGSTVARDDSGNGNHGTLTSYTATQTMTGWVANPSHASKFFNPYALEFDGVDDYVNIAYNNSLDLTRGATLSVWFNTDVLSTNQTFIRKNNAYIFYFYGANLDFYLYGPDYRLSISKTNFATDKWYHAVATYNSSSMKIYIDGALIQSIAQTGSISTNTNPVLIGTSGGAYQYDGLLDDARIYNRALSQSEVSRLAAGDANTGSGVYVLGSALALSGDLKIQSGELRTGNAYPVTLSGSFANHAQFTSTGTVTMDGTAGQQMSGSTVFNNFTAATAETITMDFRARQSFSGALTLQNITLISSKTGSSANILLDGSSGTQTSIDHVAVSDSDATGGQEIVCYTTAEGCTNNGRNVNWNFTDAEPPAAGGTPKTNNDYFYILFKMWDWMILKFQGVT